MAAASKSPSELIHELRALVVDYAKQETVDPLKALGRYLAWGVVGSLLLCIGSIFVCVGLLRLLQSQTGAWFDGPWSFVPYVVVLLFAVVALCLLVSAVLRTKKTELERP